MPVVRRPIWTRRSEAGLHLEFFLVAAVSAVLGIRAFLELTGYPKVGGGGLHIAHLLWGGAFMLVALVLILTFLDRPVLRAAAVIGGLGFGVFIDEVGKFLTTDNDYFFRPAIALIYVVFIGLFLIVRVVLAGPTLSPREALANAIHLSEEGVDGSISPGVRVRILALLRMADPHNPLTRHVRDYVKSLNADPERTTLTRTGRIAAIEVERLVSNSWFDRALLLVVAVYAIATVASSLVVGLVAGDQNGTNDAARIAETVSSVVGAVFVLIGIIRFPVSRIAGYRWFIRGILVWILVTQVFAFYNSQLAALAGLAFDLVAYVVLRSLLTRELRRSERRAAEAADEAEAERPGRSAQPA